jgi:hypothetical protein
MRFCFYNLSLILSAGLLFSCGPEQAPRKPVNPRKLFGQWRSVYFRVEMPSFQNGDSTKTIEVNEESWERAMGLKPLRYYFWADSTYNILHYNLKDSLVFNPSGKWRIELDTLVMQDTFPKLGELYKYRIELKGDIVEFSGLEDADSDGKKDDQYYSTQRRFVVKP